MVSMQSKSHRIKLLRSLCMDRNNLATFQTRCKVIHQYLSESDERAIVGDGSGTRFGMLLLLENQNEMHVTRLAARQFL